MSLRASSFTSPAACSGDRYAGVPATLPSAVSSPRPNRGRSERTSPKSSNFATSNTPPRSHAITLLGLMSR